MGISRRLVLWSCRRCEKRQIDGGGHMITNVAVQEKYVNVLAGFGSLQDAIDTALQRYAIEQVTTKINDLRRREAKYLAKYGLDYSTFSQRIAHDEGFIEQVEANISKTWELDLAEWEFCYKGIRDWTRQLQALLLA